MWWTSLPNTASSLISQLVEMIVQTSLYLFSNVPAVRHRTVQTPLHPRCSAATVLILGQVCRPDLYWVEYNVQDVSSHGRALVFNSYCNSKLRNYWYCPLLCWHTVPPCCTQPLPVSLLHHCCPTSGYANMVLLCLGHDTQEHWMKITSPAMMLHVPAYEGHPVSCCTLYLHSTSSCVRFLQQIFRVECRIHLPNQFRPLTCRISTFLKDCRQLPSYNYHYNSELPWITTATASSSD